MKKSSTIVLQTIIVLIGIAALAFLLWEPQLEGRNVNATNFEIYFNDTFLAYVYLGSIAFFVGLYKAFKVLGYAKQNNIASQESIHALRTIQRCAMILVGFVIGGEIFIISNNSSDDRAGGVFMGLLIALGSTVMGMTARMIKRKLQNRNTQNATLS